MDSSNWPSVFSGFMRPLNSMLRRYEAGERNFSGIRLTGFKLLRDVNLSGADLSRAQLQSVDLSGANLSNTNLENADLSGSELADTNLSGANLINANLRYARLIRANLTGANLQDADLDGATIVGCIMPDGTEDPALERIENAIGHLKQPTWKPIVQAGDSDLRNSKFAGKPWLSAGESWPHCAECGNPLRFFFQLNLNQIPEELREKLGSGILQLFYCTNNYECGGGMAFFSGQQVRIVRADGAPAEFDIPKAPENLSQVQEGEFPPKTIVSWQQTDDYPEWSDIKPLGIDLDVSDSSFMYHVGLYTETDKLAGWPRWIQAAEYPSCPICEQEMKQLIFQLGSDDNIPFLWGDAGIGYILQCETHKDQVTFLWQCG